MPIAPMAIDWPRLSRQLGVVCLGLGLAVLAGWQFDILILRAILPGLISMQPPTAIAFVLLGSVLAFPDAPRPYRIAASCLALAMGAMTLFAFVMRTPLFLDTLMYSNEVLQQLPHPRHPGRMSEGAALSLTVLAALLATHRIGPKAMPARLQFWLAIAPLLIGAISLMAYLLGVKSARGVIGYTDLALHTAAGVCLLSVATLALRPEVAWLKVIGEGRATGRMMRRILIPIVVLPPALSLLTLKASQIGLITPELRLALVTLGTMIGLTVLALMSSRRMSEAEASLEAESARAQASEARLATLIANAQEAIVSANADGRITGWNSQAATIFGWMEAEALGRPFVDMLIPERFRAAHNAGLTRFLQSGQPTVIGQRLELPALRRDGSEFTIEMALSAGRYGDCWQFTAMMHDITARIAQTQLFETAFEHAPIGVALVGLDGRFLKVNGALCALVGYDEAELVASDFQKITHPDDLDRDLSLLDQLHDSAIPDYELDKRYIRKDGKAVWVNLSVSAVREHNGRPKHYIAQVIDLTERMEAEARYRLMTENSSDMIVTTTLDGRPLFVSAASRTLLGVSATEATERNPTDYIHADDLPGLRDVFARTAHGETGLRVRWRAWHVRNKAWTWLESSPSLLVNGDAATAAFVDVIRGVDAQVAQEQALEAAMREAEAAAAVKGDFLANMSHEIRTPLTVIIGFSGLLQDHADLSDETRRYAGRIATAGNALLSVVNDILDFSKLEAGELDIRLCAAHAVEMSEELLSLLQLQAEAKEIRLNFEVEGAIPNTLLFDPECYRQVLLNLLGNAIKFTDSGHVTLRLDYRDEQLSVEVEDTGCGLTQDDQAKLFQRFSQVDGSSTRKHGGTGLGLAICKGLVEAMGGAIGVTSQVGQGSTFHFRLPAPALDPATLSGEERHKQRLDGMRILVTDDNATNRELARALLESAGAEVLEACDGVAAVEAARLCPFDAILMDYRMPNLDGVGAMAQIRSQPGPNRYAPILGFSATDRVQLLKLGFDGAVVKPIVQAALIEAVITAIEDETGHGHVAFG